MESKNIREVLKEETTKVVIDLIRKGKIQQLYKGSVEAEINFNGSPLKVRLYDFERVKGGYEWSIGGCW